MRYAALLLLAACGTPKVVSKPQPPPAASSAAPAPPASTGRPPPLASASPDDSNDPAGCLRLFSALDKPMKEARYRWTMGGRSDEGETHNGWVVLPHMPDAPDEVNLEWGPPLAPGQNKDEPYPFVSELELDANKGSREEQAEKMLGDLGYVGDLESKVMAFQADAHLAEHGLRNGKVPPATWSKLRHKFKKSVDDPNTPPECND